MTVIKRFAAISAIVVWAVATEAQDMKGSKDHPAIKRYEGSTIIAYETQNFDALLIPTGKLAHDTKLRFPKAINAEGEVTQLRYKAPVGRTSLEVFRNYESALQAAGFQILYTCTKAECGDGDTFAQTLYGIGAQPLTLNQKSQAFLSAKLSRPGGAMYVRVFTIENHAWASEAKTAEGQVVTQLDVVETKGMDSGMVTVDANAMRSALEKDGRVALYGIYFDSGQAVVKSESGPALGEIAKLLVSTPSMRLLVVGHTDSDGSFATNRDLSQKRAAAVVQELAIKHGIAQSRLTPVGVAFAAPVATNRSTDGKAKNRRVELVEY
jgi:OmpA-OmpF porin, OOP family